MTDGLHLSARHREALEALLRAHLPGVEAWAYGSRANGGAHDGSDLDLVLRGAGLREIPAERLADFADAVRESNIPFLVEARDWACLPARFHREVERGYIVLVAAETQEENGWSRINLGDCMDIVNSTYSPSEKWPFINYLDTGNIRDNRISEIKRMVVGVDKIPSRARRKAVCGDIIYSTVRPNQRHYGLLRNIPRNFLVSTGFAVLRCQSGIAHPDFIYWFLTQDHIVDHLQTIAEHSTSTYPAIRPEDIALLPIDLPPLSEQQAIADILRALDDKIALNSRMNETLDAMTQAAFDDWFVHFGPTRAKSEGRDPYLPEHIWSLFPDRLVDSELGKIPAGWECGQVSDFATIKGGKQLPKDKFVENGPLPVLGGAGVMGYANCYNADGYVISVGRVGAYCGQFFSHWGRAWVNNNASLVSHKEGIQGEWLFLALNMLDVDSMRKGSAQPYITNSDLSSMKVIAPAASVIERFSEFSRPLTRRSGEITREIREITTLRSTLLPKLMSGEFRLNGAVDRLRGAA